MGTPTFQCLQPKMLLPLHFSFSHNHHHSVKDASSLPSKCIQKLCAEDHSALLHGYHQNRGSGPPLPEWLQQDPNWSSCCSPLPLSPLVPLPLCLSSSCLTHQHSCHWVSVQFSPSVMSDSLRPHGLQHAKSSQSIANSWSLLKLMSIGFRSQWTQSGWYHLVTLLHLQRGLLQIQLYSEALGEYISWGGVTIQPTMPPHRPFSTQ